MFIVHRICLYQWYTELFEVGSINTKDYAINNEYCSYISYLKLWALFTVFVFKRVDECRRSSVQERAREGRDHKTYRPLIARMLLAIYPPINPDPPETFMAIYFPQILNEIFLIFIRPVVPLLKTIGFMTAHVTGTRNKRRRRDSLQQHVRTALYSCCEQTFITSYLPSFRNWYTNKSFTCRIKHFKFENLDSLYLTESLHIKTCSALQGFS